MTIRLSNRKRNEGHCDGTPVGYRFRRLIPFIYTFVLLALVFSNQAEGDNIRVQVDSTEGYAGGGAGVRILLENDIPIASVIVPLRYDSERLVPDSVTFDGSVVNPDHLYMAAISDDSSVIKIVVVPTITSPMPMIYDPGGLLATVWFSISPFATSRYSAIDTAYVADSISLGDEILRFYPIELQASDPAGTQLYPSFRAGGVMIRTD